VGTPAPDGYSKSKRLAEELQRVRQEKDMLMGKLLEK
jgi:hypothetical protein